MMKLLIPILAMASPALALAETGAETRETVVAYQVDQRAFAAHIRNCTPFHQEVRVFGTSDQTMRRSVEGPRGELCEIRVEAASDTPADLHCLLPAGEIEAFAGGHHAMSDNLQISGEFAEDWPNDVYPGVAEVLAGDLCTLVNR
jgi:hypothetical protein